MYVVIMLNKNPYSAKPQGQSEAAVIWLQIIANCDQKVWYQTQANN